ncbi:hypothetical protein SEA_JUANYO_35 [Microbacterium phage Juanyo]|nr:hypothetical protein SEA_JUANYO_35 [Microbacterium phage Juanyo]
MRALTFACSYCGADPGHPCVVTLAPEVGPLSIRWNHRAREEGGQVA